MPVDKESNPYASPTAEPLPSAPSRLRYLWPQSPAGCILFALIVWPVTMYLTEVLGMAIEPLFTMDDFGLVAANFTVPIVWLYAIALWFRAFLIRERSWRSVILAILTVPLWLILTLVVSLFNFPQGRVDPTF